MVGEGGDTHEGNMNRTFHDRYQSQDIRVNPASPKKTT
ncbi:hypothetical protein ASZ90_016562 [hydrocarbon metagenome]|uniref:Uncharacterized protein n=1 Tax=hydrocarbon metagenome TaxID=938273 RepID=A0A0W8ENS6_9ZZZZ